MHLSTNFGKEIREKKSPGTNGLKGMSAIALKRISMFREKVVHSSSVNGKNCVVKMFIKPDNVHRKVKFSHCTIYYY